MYFKRVVKFMDYETEIVLKVVLLKAENNVRE